jgi:hypothetical protein
VSEAAVYAFMTRQDDGRDRTSGLISYAGWPSSLTGHAGALGRLLAPFPGRTPAARGKVVLIGPGPRSSDAIVAHVYQTGARGAAQLVACGNAVCATAAILFECGIPRPTFMVPLPGSTSRACADVRTCTSGWRVDLTWHLRPPAFIKAEFEGRDVLLASGLNNYRIVVARGDSECTVTRLTLLVRREGSRSKAVVIAPGDGLPGATFINSNGQHGAAPLSGLIVLAQAAAVDDGVRAALMGCTRVRTAGGTIEELPAVAVVTPGRSISVRLPSLMVELQRLAWLDMQATCADSAMPRGCSSDAAGGAHVLSAP